MRCQQCGRPNRTDAKICSKCGCQLESDEQAGQFTDSNAELKKTISEQEAFGGQVVQPNICPKCSYPLRPGTMKCPNCEKDLSDAPQQGHIPAIEEPKRTPVRRPTVLNAPKINDTVNVWTEGNIGVTPSFILSPIKRNGERHEPENMEFEGTEISLNRDNTDPNNMSITSKVQAVVVRKDDKWFIEDKSEQKTTFIQARTPQPLQDGDIILLGNRLFVFHE